MIYLLDGLSIPLVVFYLQRGQICHIPYTARMASVPRRAPPWYRAYVGWLLGV